MTMTTLNIKLQWNVRNQAERAETIQMLEDNAATKTLSALAKLVGVPRTTAEKLCKENKITPATGRATMDAKTAETKKREFLFKLANGERYTHAAKELSIPTTLARKWVAERAAS